jgi:hypothetical protein
LILPVMFAVFNGTVYGLVWSARVGRTLVHEHEQGTFEILSITPDGALGATWAICTGCIHRSGAFDSLRVFSLEEFAVAWTITLVLNAGKWQQYLNFFEGNSPFFPILVLMVYSLMLILTFYFNNVQSIIVGVLVGMGISTSVRNRLDAQLWAIGIYVLLQITTYLLTWIIAGVILPTFFVMNVPTEILLAFISLGVFYLIREALIVSLWRILMFKLNSDANEIQQSFG